MPEMNNVEETLLKGMEARATTLRNGGKGDVCIMSEALADVIDVLAAMVRTGGVSPAECREMHLSFAQQIARDRAEYLRTTLEKESAVLRREIALLAGGASWKAALAVTVPICVAVCGVLIPVVIHMVRTL